MNLADFNARWIYPDQAMPPYTGGGILGGGEQQPSGILGGGGGLSQLLDPQVALPIAAQLIGGRNFQQSLSGAAAAAAQAIPDAKRRAALNAWIKAKSGQSIDPETAQLLQNYPDLAASYAQKSLVGTGQQPTAAIQEYNYGEQHPEFRQYQKDMKPGSGGDDPLTVRRWTLSANAAVSPYIKMPAYSIMANAAPMLSRIESASDVPGSVSDQELLDSVTKLNTGGGQVTEAQVNTVLRGQSLADKANVWQKYIAEHGGVLSDDQRKQLLDVAHAVYSGYQKMYEPIYKAATKALDDRHIPAEYRGAIPDLNSLSQAAGIDFRTGGGAGAVPTNAGGADPISQARDAISRGADPDAVKKRLRDNGIDPSGL